MYPRKCSRCGTDFLGVRKYQGYCPECNRVVANANYHDIELPKTPYQLRKKNSPSKDASYHCWIGIRRTAPNVTLDDVRTFINQFTGKCDICSASIDGRNRHLDHCHKTGKLRGWLCHGCNIGLGMFKDDFETLKAAALYVKIHTAR